MAEMTREERLKLFADSFQQAAEHYFNEAADDETKDSIVCALEDSLRNFTKSANPVAQSAKPSGDTPNNNNCPKFWTRCADGSCVPPGTICPE